MTVIKFQEPELTDKGGPKFTRIESIIDFGPFFELVFVNDKVSPPTRAGVRMARETFEKLCEEVERIAPGKVAEVQAAWPDGRAASDTGELNDCSPADEQ
jgi:hypothetical protein